MHTCPQKLKSRGWLLPLPTSSQELTYRPPVGLDATFSEPVICWNTAPTQNEYSFKIYLKTLLHSMAL